MPATILATAALTGPAPEAGFSVYAVPSRLKEGTFTALSQEEESALSQPAPTVASGFNAFSTAQYGATLPLLYTGGPLTQVKNIAIPEGMRAIVVLRWAYYLGAADTSFFFYGYLHGWRWQKDSLRVAQKLLLLQQP